MFYICTVFIKQHIKRYIKDYKYMANPKNKQRKPEKKVVMTTGISISETMLGIKPGETVEYTVFDFGIENARTTANYLKRKRRGYFSVSKTSPTTFAISRLG